MFTYGNKSGKAPMQKFWTYDYCQNFELKQEFIDAYKQKGKFYEDALYFYDYMSTSPHPMFKQEKESVEPNYINFSNIMIDINTLKILFCLLPNTKIITIKFSSNSLEFSNFDYLINQVMTKNTNVYNLIFEWNDEVIHEGKKYKMIDNINKIEASSLKQNYNTMNPSKTDSKHEINMITQELEKNVYVPQVHEILIKQKNLIAKLTSHVRLDSLCLRGNFICDDAAIILFENLKNNINLRVLGLYRNYIGSKCVNSIVSMLENNKKLEELNLGYNNFTDEDFRLISQVLGKYKLSEEESEDLQRKIKEKNEIIEKNKKLKATKKPELPLPVVPDVETIGEQFFIVKNMKLKNLNMMQNKFTKDVYHIILRTLDVTEDLLLVFDLKLFDKQEKEKLSDQRNKFSSKVYLVK
jgi:hypothetical protein